jgi:mono/diheme cytochrome c family protein
MCDIRHRTGACLSFFLMILALPLMLAAAPARGAAMNSGGPLPESGRELYAMACMACHGPDGTGMGRERVGFDLPVRDFTDCNFATREANRDWTAVVAEGGPARGFSEVMPAFGGLLSDEQIVKVLDYMRGFCVDASWPRGELNLPRPLFTGKAFPEDEVALTGRFTTSGDKRALTRVIYEKRIGARGQIEFTLPFEWMERPTPDGDAKWEGGVGDAAVSAKRVLFASLESGSIVSVGGEFILPTGNENKGLGSGTAVFEPYIAYGQILPLRFFVQFQGGSGISFDTDKVDDEAFWRIAAGRTFYQGHLGRAWTPMVELLGASSLVSGAHTEWDLAPQFQVTLSSRQHVRLNLGARIPLNNTDERKTEIGLYLLWDWFDGGLLEGW